MRFAGARVFKAKRGGVQRLPVERIKHGFLRLGEVHSTAFHARAIQLITQHRMADMRHMHA